MGKNRSAKLKLEGFIFSRAACLRASVAGVGGKLCSECLEPYLQVSIYLYNQCFFSPEKIEFAADLAKLLISTGGVKNGWILPRAGILSDEIDKIYKIC